MSSLMKGTAILTIGLFLSKLLGLIYIFPFYAIVGEEAMGLYNYAYIPYSIMLSIALGGIPLGVSKFVSKYNALGDYDAGRRLVKSGFVVMTITGILAFLALNLLAEPIAHRVIEDDEQIFNTDQIATVIRWVSYALLVVPFMSLVRGFMQGYGHFMPTSVSQLVEQIARIIALLGGAFVIVYILDGSKIAAVNFSVFSAFIGAIGGLMALYVYWKKLRPEIKAVQVKLPKEQQIPYRKMYKELITYSIPFVFVGLSNPLFQLVDMLTFNEAMVEAGLAKVTDTYFLMLNMLTHKIVIIPVMLATGFSMAIIPLVTQQFTAGNLKGVRQSMDKVYQVMLFITIPAVAGIMLLSEDIYHVLYSQSEMGAEVLAHYAPAAILFALFAVTASMLQGIDYQKWIMFSLALGILTKFVLNAPLIRLMSVDGAILATIIGYSVTILINIAVIHKATQYKSKVMKRRVLLIFILTGIMALVVKLAHAGLVALAPADTKFLAVLYAFICAGLGGAVYGIISLKLGLAQLLLGSKVTKLANKLGFK